MALGKDYLIQQVKQGAALGHQISVERRDPPPEYPAGRIKFWAVCSCGYRSTQRVTDVQAFRTAIWHLGKVIGLSSDEARQRARDGLPARGDTPAEVPTQEAPSLVGSLQR